MIAYLKGKVIQKHEKNLIINTANVGYLVHINKILATKIKETQEIELFIHTHVREDSLDLYGFINFNELDFFKKLISVSGIGPKTGLEFFNLPIDKIKTAIVTDDSKFLTQIPGVGLKTAKRLILELKNKIELENIAIQDLSPEKELHKDIVEALENLGFNRQHISKTLKTIPENISSEAEIISYFLKNS